MAWNLPGKGGSDKGGKDPWKGRDSERDTRAFLDRLRQGLGRMFGGEPGEGDSGPRFALWIGILLAVWVCFSSFQVVNQNQIGVVVRFGHFDRTMAPGINLKWPWPIESVTSIDATMRSASDSVRMITSDQDIVQIDYNVQYTVSDPRQFLFGSSGDPGKTLQLAAESVVREVAGAATMDDVLQGNGAVHTAHARERLQKILDQYHAGLQVADFTLKSAGPPQELKEAFEDASHARQDKDKAINAARAYASDVIPRARGDAASLTIGAEAYKAAIIAQAQGNAQRFAPLAEEYHKAPEVTRRRLYLETMEDVLKGVSKVVAGRGTNTIYVSATRAQEVSGSAGTDAAQPVNLPAVTATVPQAAAEPLRTDRAGRSDERDGSR